MPLDLPDEAANPSLQDTLERAVELAQVFAAAARELAADPVPSADVLARVEQGWSAHRQVENGQDSAAQFDLMRAIEHAAEHDPAAALAWFAAHWPRHTPDPVKFEAAVKAWPTGSKWKDVAAAIKSAGLSDLTNSAVTQVWHRYRRERGYPPLHPL